ncbi:hypothetical protein [Streptomyces sp. NPDC058701]|uniref:hypothetical protein n=1 Tax=Streptomyces sp. NPDC058701 TaxID=3346608 RepID=UPI00365AE5DD
MSTRTESAVTAAAGTLITHSAIYCLALGYDREEFRLLARKSEDMGMPHMAEEYHQQADQAAGLHHAVSWRFCEDTELIGTHWEPLLAAVVRREAYELVEADRARKHLAQSPNDSAWGDIWQWELKRAERNATQLAELKAKLTAVRDALRTATA